MSYWEIVQLVICLSIAFFVAVMVFYLGIKLAAYGWYRGKYLFFESKARRLKRWRHNDESERSGRE